MTVVFLATFVVGLLLAVRVMIVGVERPRELNPSGERSFRISPPIIVAFALVYGVSGYLMVRGGLVRPLTAAVIAAGLGAAASVAAAWLVRTWWRVTPE